MPACSAARAEAKTRETGSSSCAHVETNRRREPPRPLIINSAYVSDLSFLFCDPCISAGSELCNSPFGLILNAPGYEKDFRGEIRNPA